MPDLFYHIKIKKDHAAALINHLIKEDAVEDLEPDNYELPQWQKDLIDTRLEAIAATRQRIKPIEGLFNALHKQD